MNGEKCLARIIPAPQRNPGEPQITTGSKIMIGNVELRAVQRVELVAEPNSLWRAKVECCPVLPEAIDVAADVTFAIPLGYHLVDVTCLGDTEEGLRRFALVPDAADAPVEEPTPAAP